MAGVAVLNRVTPQVPIRTEFDPNHSLLQRAREGAAALGFSGSLSPQEAWQLVGEQNAVLLDVRTAEERKFVGFVPRSVHIPWQTGTSLQTNPRFVRELESKIAKESLVLVLCRSGARSAAAAAAAAKAGFRHVYSIQGGFEGDLDESRQRGHRNGWRVAGLPWEQD